MGIAVNIDSVGTQQFNIVGAEKITHTQPTYYNPISTRYQDADEKNKAPQVSKPEEVTEKYSAEEAIAHNAQLPGALQAGVALTQEQASAYNDKITGAAKEKDNTLVKYDLNKNILTRENDNLRMEYVFNKGNETEGTIFIKELK